MGGPLPHVPGHLLYLCRRCRRTVRGPDVPDIGTAVGYLSQGAIVPAPWGEALTPVRVHVCPDESLGVTDLAGAVADGAESEIPSSSGGREGG